MKRLSMVLVGAVLLAGGCAGADEQRFIKSVLNKPAPDFQLQDLDGSSVRLSSFRGRPVVVAFFAYG